MSRRPLLQFALLALLASTLSCAVADGPGVDSGAGYAPPPAAATQPAARFGLAPAYRVFYDALEGTGEWVLIEPFGWVFRPRVTFGSWRPYQQGWWEPSEVYGWVWLSSDDFGWITDHYGSWFYDDYQGWVWQPGPVWGPAWVAWVEVGDYVGWAPLGPADYQGYGDVPGSLFTFARTQQFGMQQANAQALYLSRPPDTKAVVVEVTNVGRVGGVSFNRGPDFTQVQRLGGAVPVRPEEPNLRRVKLPEVKPPGEAEFLLRTRRLLAEGLRNIEALRDGKPAGTPPPPERTPSIRPGAPGTPPDSGAAAPRRKDAPGLHERPRRPGDPGRSPGAEPDSSRG